MSSFRYIGSKTRVLHEITGTLGEPTSGRFVDVFSGTGAVSRAAAQQGWAVLANDHLLSAAILTRAQLAAESEVLFEEWGGYKGAIRALNSVSPVDGFIYRTYTPASVEHSEHKRMYFTEENGGLIDAIRGRIADWYEAGRLDGKERAIVIADLLVAADRVANTAGTYGAFLRSWSANTRSRLRLQMRRLLPVAVPHEVTCIDAFELDTNRNDVAYLDPPYTKRQYAAYYHVLETIAHNDEPDVTGVTGLRPWEHRASPFCYKEKALGAITELTFGLNASRILLSYNNDGHVPLTDLLVALGQGGGVQAFHLGSIGQYSANGSNAQVGEFLLELDKTEEPGSGLNEAKKVLHEALTDPENSEDQLTFKLAGQEASSQAN